MSYNRSLFNSNTGSDANKGVSIRTQVVLLRDVANCRSGWKSSFYSQLKLVAIACHEGHLEACCGMLSKVLKTLCLRKALMKIFTKNFFPIGCINKSHRATFVYSFRRRDSYSTIFRSRCTIFLLTNLVKQ